MEYGYWVFPKNMRILLQNVQLCRNKIDVVNNGIHLDCYIYKKYINEQGIDVVY